MYILIFAFGLALASFLNALAYRLRTPSGIDSVFISSSHCESCKRKLKWFELIPVISFLFQKGTCRSCGYRVPIYYPLSELFLGVSFFLLYYHSTRIELYLVLVVVFFLTYWDIKDRSVPKKVVDISIILALIYYVYILINLQSMDIIGGGLLAFTIFLLSFLINIGKEKVGMGDILILSLILIVGGLRIGVGTLVATIFISGVYAIILVLIDKENRKKYIPMYPFILISYTLSIPYSSPIFDYIIDSFSLL